MAASGFHQMTLRQWLISLCTVLLMTVSSWIVHEVINLKTAQAAQESSNAEVLRRLDRIETKIDAAISVLRYSR